MRFLLRWQRVTRNTLIGADGLARIIEQLQGFETAAGAWEREVLPARLHGYDQTWLDQLCLAGQIVWCRLSPRRATPEPEPEPEPEPDDVAGPAVAAELAGAAVGRAADLPRLAPRPPGSVPTAPRSQLPRRPRSPARSRTARPASSPRCDANRDAAQCRATAR
jgi:ATP-dependent Lhr-like helicase